MKTQPFSLNPLSKPKTVPAATKSSAAKPGASRKAHATRPTAWGLGVLKKIEKFRLALALER